MAEQGLEERLRKVIGEVNSSIVGLADEIVGLATVCDNKAETITGHAHALSERLRVFGKSVEQDLKYIAVRVSDAHSELSSVKSRLAIFSCLFSS